MQSIRSISSFVQGAAGPSCYTKTSPRPRCQQCRFLIKKSKRGLHTSLTPQYAPAPETPRPPTLRTRPGYLSLDTGMTPSKPRQIPQSDRFTPSTTPIARRSIPSAPSYGIPSRNTAAPERADTRATTTIDSPSLNRSPTPSTSPYGVLSRDAAATHFTDSNANPDIATISSPSQRPRVNTSPRGSNDRLSISPGRPSQSARSSASTSIGIRGASIGESPVSHIPSPSEIARHVASVDLAQLPAKLDKHQKQIGFTNLDLSLSLGPINTRKLPIYHSPLFTLRACPTRLLPPKPPPPFPPQFLRKRHESKLISMGIVTSKASVSKLATERNLARRRMMNAVRLVLDRGVGIGGEESGVGVVSDEYTYVLSLKAEMVNVPFDQIVIHAARGFVEIKKAILAGFDFGSRPRLLRR